MITTLFPMIYSLFVDDFARMNRVGPVTQEERLRLISFFIPYVVIPALMLLTMLVSDTYKGVKTTSTSKSAEVKSKEQKKKQQHYSKKRQ